MLFKTLRNVLFDYRTSARLSPTNPVSSGSVALVKVDGIGDFVLATTFLNAFRTNRAHSKVTLVCRAPVAGIAKWQFPEWQIESVPRKTKPLREILHCAPTRTKLRRLPEFDSLIDLRGYRDAADAAISSWIPARFKVALANGFPPQFRWVALPDEERVFDQYIERPPRRADECDDIAGHRRLAEAVLGIDSSNLLPQLNVTASEILSLRQKLGILEKNPRLVICPGTSIPQKEYPPAALAEALRRAELPPRIQIILAGSPEDARTIGLLKASLGNGSQVLDLSGRLTLVENAVLIASATAVVAMDSCHAHIAGATGTPALVMLTGQQRGFFGPWNSSEKYRWLFSSAPQTAASQPFVYGDYLTTDTLPLAKVAAEISALIQAVGT